MKLLIDTGRLEEAAEAAAEMGEIADVSNSELFAARAHRAEAMVALAEGHAGSAADLLKGAVATLTRLGVPYEAALAHSDLGRAYRLEGVEAMAQMELKVAAAELEKLGATGDAERVSSLIAGA